MNITVQSIPAVWLSVALSIMMLFTCAVGYVLGARRKRVQETEAEVVGRIDGSTLALLGLLLGFTFAMSLSKHDRRREMVVADANAIGDFATCVDLLPEPARTRLREVTRQYVRHRVELVKEAIAPDRLDAALNEVATSHQRLTRGVYDAVRLADTPLSVATPLVQKLTDLTSSHTARLAAARDVLPASVLILLFTSATVAAFLLGREQGFAHKPAYLTMILFTVLVSLVVYVILDLNQPRRGLITVSQEPMERLLESLESATTSES